MNFGVKFALVTGLQVLCLVGMIGYKYISLASGTEVVLEVPRPKDPRSLFSGDFVYVRYAINNIDLKTVSNNMQEHEMGRAIYVELKREGAVWKPANVTLTKPEKGVFIKGKIIGDSGDNTIEVEYGIEQYYVPENTGYSMEDKLRSVQKAIVSIDPLGNATIVGVPDK